MKKPSLWRRSLTALAAAPRRTLHRLLGTAEAAPSPRLPEAVAPAGRRHGDPARPPKERTGKQPAPRAASHPRGSSNKQLNQTGRSQRNAPNEHSMAPEHEAPTDFQWIDNDAQLQELVVRLSAKVGEGKLTRTYLDTEADSLHHYTEKLCLLQLAADGEFFLIDPLKCTELAGLFALLDSTELWLHGADYDLTLLKRLCGWTPIKVHDTQIAARLAGQRAFGLAALVQHYCGVTLCKSSQKADWSQRPLPAKMQAYAVDDVRYLAVLSDTLMKELAAANRTGWFEQSCAALRKDVMNRAERDRSDSWRISGSGNLRPKGLALLREIWLWRDSTAAEKDVPPFKVLNNQQLLSLAFEFEEKGTASHSPRWRPKWRETFTAAVHKVRQSDPETWPQRAKRLQRRSTEEERARIEQLCALRETRASKLGLEPALLGSRDTLMDLVLNAPKEGDDSLMPWQREVLGLV